eukprot:12934740-Ditylum_brightwellii.AAC.1
MFNLYIVISGELFDSVIIKDEMPIVEMPPVQLPFLDTSIGDDKIAYKEAIQKNIIDAIF